MKKWKYPLTLLTWIDHCDYGDTPWLDLEDIQEHAGPMKITSIGWIVCETDLFLVLSNSHGRVPDDGVGSALVIIKSCITKREEVEWK